MTKPERPARGRINTDVFKQAEWWIDYHGKYHRVSEIDREYAQAILKYIDRRWWGMFDAENSPLVRALTVTAEQGRTRGWLDKARLRWYWVRRRLHEWVTD